MARGQNFKLKQLTKRASHTILDAHERGEFLRIMISAQNAYDHFQISRAKDRSERLAPAAGVGGGVAPVTE